jgi:hypothetical protein
MLTGTTSNSKANAFAVLREAAAIGVQFPKQGIYARWALQDRVGRMAPEGVHRVTE